MECLNCPGTFFNGLEPVCIVRAMGSFRQVTIGQRLVNGHCVPIFAVHAGRMRESQPPQMSAPPPRTVAPPAFTSPRMAPPHEMVPHAAPSRAQSPIHP